MPNVEMTMKAANVMNIIYSGCKTPESELQNFDPEPIIEKFKRLMDKLPITMATFHQLLRALNVMQLLKPSQENLRLATFNKMLVTNI